MCDFKLCKACTFTMYSCKLAVVKFTSQFETLQQKLCLIPAIYKLIQILRHLHHYLLDLPVI